MWLAHSGSVRFPDGTTGGDNPSGLPDGRPCTCDPIDPADGALRETATDINVPGRGVGLELTRTYESASANVVSRFGFGWSDAYTMRLLAAPDDDGSLPGSLAEASNVQVIQENGEPVSFAKQADGSYATSSNMLASLRLNSDGSYTFTRAKRSMFSFDSYGRLVGESDLHHNTTTLAYDGDGRLATVTDPAGRTLSYSYNDRGLVPRVDGPGGRSETYSYDDVGNLVSAADETGATPTTPLCS